MSARLRARRTGRQRAWIAAGTTATLLLLLTASALGYGWYRFTRIERISVSIDAADAGEPRNFLLVGSDSRDGLDPDDPANDRYLGNGEIGGLRTDTIMVLRVDPAAERASLLSFPRDLWVEIAGEGANNRINTAFGKGRDVLIDTIRENFDIPINHYVEVDLAGFLDAVDAIGGVDLYFPDPVRDRNSGLDVPAAGCVTLDGPQALAFARSRYLEVYDAEDGRWRTDPSGDLGRISRQQELIRRAIGEAVDRGLSNPVALNDLVITATDNVGLDPTLGIEDILDLARRFSSFDPSTLDTYSVPVEPFRTSGGAAVLDVVALDAEPIFNIFRGLPPDEVTPALVEVQVLNGTGADGQGADATAALSRIGFATVEPANTRDPFTETTIFYAPGSEPAAERVARHVSGPTRFGIDEDLGRNEVVLVTGADFTTLHTQPSPERPLSTTTTTTTSTTLTDGAETTTTLQVIPESTTSTTAAIGYVPEPDLAAAACGA